MEATSSVWGSTPYTPRHFLGHGHVLGSTPYAPRLFWPGLGPMAGALLAWGAPSTVWGSTPYAPRLSMHAGLLAVTQACLWRPPPQSGGSTPYTPRLFLGKVAPTLLVILLKVPKPVPGLRFNSKLGLGLGLGLGLEADFFMYFSWVFW